MNRAARFERDERERADDPIVGIGRYRNTMISNGSGQLVNPSRVQLIRNRILASWFTLVGPRAATNDQSVWDEKNGLELNIFSSSSRFFNI